MSTLDKLCHEIALFAKKSGGIVILSDINITKKNAPIPMILATSAVNQYLSFKKVKNENERPAFESFMKNDNNLQEFSPISKKKKSLEPIKEFNNQESNLFEEVQSPVINKNEDIK